METADPRAPVGFGKAPTGGRRGSFAEAARFWEPRRVIYNLILTAVAVFWVVKTWPHFRPAMRLDALLKLTVLALLANLCYSAAYVVDIAMQQSGLGAGGDAARSRARWGLWAVGTLLAMFLESYWILDEIYPDVQ
jgi:hypothetical protein